MNTGRVWKFCRANSRHTLDYKFRVQEVSRVNYQAIRQHDSKFPGSSLSRAVMDYLSRSNWRLTRHTLDRISEYKNKQSRDGTYPELLPVEADFLMQVNNWKARAPWNVVQVGFNLHQEICKVGLVTKFRPDISSRWLFLCVGADYGIKTFYVTPEFKDRQFYCEQNGIRSLSCQELACQLKNKQ